VLVDGEPCRSLAVVQREAPREGPDAVVLPLAALAARSPADGRPLVTEVVESGYAGDARAFVADLARLLLPPLLTLLRLGAADDARALRTGPLPVKAMTAMRLAAEPLDDIWTVLPNPLAGLV